MSFGLLNDFLQTSKEERVEVLYRYLVNGESGSFIAEDFYSNKNYAWKISAITQGYCEKGGKNRGKISTTPEEIKAFVEGYPNGTHEIGLTFSDWLVNGSRQRTSELKEIAKNFGETMGDIIYTPSNTNVVVDKILDYIYSQGLGFASEYKYSIVLQQYQGVLEKLVREIDLYGEPTYGEPTYGMGFVAFFEDYLVFISNALTTDSRDLLIPFKEIKKFNLEFDLDGRIVPQVFLYYKGKNKIMDNYFLSFFHHDNNPTNSYLFYQMVTLQYEYWKLQGQQNYSSQLPIIRKYLEGRQSPTRYIANVLYLYLCEGFTIESLTDTVLLVGSYPTEWKRGVREFSKLLFFDYRLKLSDRGKLSYLSLAPKDFDRFVEKFYNGIRVDKDEMKDPILGQDGLSVIEHFLWEDTNNG